MNYWALLRGAKEAFDVHIILCSMGYARTLTVYEDGIKVWSAALSPGGSLGDTVGGACIAV